MTMPFNTRVSANILIFTKNGDDSGGKIRRGESRICQGGGWYLSLQNQRDMFPKCYNLRIETLTRDTSNATKQKSNEIH